MAGLGNERWIQELVEATNKLGGGVKPAWEEVHYADNAENISPPPQTDQP